MFPQPTIRASRLGCPLGQTPGINTEHPLWAKSSPGAVISWVPMAGGLFNIPTGKPGVQFNTAHFSGTMVRPIIGHSLIQNSNSAGLTFNGSGANSQTLDRQTFAIICIFDTLGAQSYYLGKTQNGSGAGLAWALNANGTRTLNMFAHGGSFTYNQTATFNTGSFSITTGVPYLLVGSGINLASTVGNFVAVNLQTGQYLAKTKAVTTGTVNAHGDANPLATNATNQAGNGVIGALAAGFQIPAYFEMPELLAWATTDPWSFWYPGGPIRIVGASTAKTIVADAGSYALTGTNATLKLGRALAAAAGSYDLTGAAAALNLGKRMTADAGAYAISGTDAALKLARSIAAAAGAYAITGSDASLKLARSIAAAAGAYSLTGIDAGLITAANKTVSADAGSYSISGTAASLLHAWKLAAAAGAYSLTGTDAGLLRGLAVIAAAGGYTLTGSDAALIRGHPLAAGAGAYSLAGNDAALVVLRELIAALGTYALTGSNATLTHSAASLIADIIIALAAAEATVTLAAAEADVTLSAVDRIH